MYGSCEYTAQVIHIMLCYATLSLHISVAAAR